MRRKTVGLALIAAVTLGLAVVAYGATSTSRRAPITGR